MTERRAARARIPLSGRPGGAVPRCLLIGRCIEVWSADGGSTDFSSAMRRFSTVRRYVLDRLKVTTVTEQCQAVPLGSPWSADFLISRERQGRSSEARVTEHLARAGCTVHDLPRLRDDAEALLTEAEANRPAPYRRKKT